MTAECAVSVTRPDAATQLDSVAEETPIAFEYNGIAHLVMLASPADLEDLAVGFSLTEGIVDRVNDIFDVQSVVGEQGITLKIEVAASAFLRLKERRRNLAGRTGCGLCGTESLSQVMRDLPPVSRHGTFPVGALYEGIRRLPPEQSLQQATGAAHAACHVDADGAIACVREDVGRHNALDKTLGALAAAGCATDGGLIVTSRASFEMVQKTAARGYGLLAAVSAPTVAAVRLAERLDITLVGFLRGNHCAIYSHAERLQGTRA